jgi:lactoylglutathione lyase
VQILKGVMTMRQELNKETSNDIFKEKKTIPSRILHTMLRVVDLDRSVSFYENALGMKVFSRETYTKRRFTLVFMGYGDSVNYPSIELTYNWDTEPYRHGSRYGHIALAVEDLYGLCDRLGKQGIIISRAPGQMNYAAEETGHSDTIAFIEDLDGYKIELIQG